MNNWIDVNDRLPTMEECDTEFLCCVNVVGTQIKEYQIAEWWNPLNANEEREPEDGMPEFLIRDPSTMIRKVTHWMELIDLP